MDITTACFILFIFVNIDNLNGQHAVVSQDTQNYKSSDICDIIKFARETDLIVQNCDTGKDGSQVCFVSDGERTYEYKCVEESWKLSTGTGRTYHHGRQKRFIDWLFGGLITLFAVVIYCDVFGECFEKEVDQGKIYTNPPEYKNCPKSGAVYTALSQEKSVKVTWEEPKAEDDEEVVSETQTHNNGDEFKGSPDGLKYIVTYTAKDGYGLTATCSFTFTVKYITCDTRDSPMHGRQNCSHGYIYGSECVVECYDGYEVVDGDTATCLENKTWDYTPVCQKTVCQPPFNITNGNVACDDELYRFESECLFECDSGFSLSLNSPKKMECQADKTWSVVVTSVACTDNEPPNIKCLSPQVFYADRGGFTTSVTWEGPTATDNVDPDPVIRKLSNISQGDILPEGDHYVTYEASDEEGNTLPALSKCTITLEVKVIRCFAGPTDALDKPRFINYNCSDTRYYVGVYCDLGCELNIPLNGSDRMSCERNGTTDKGVWVWDSDVQPLCEVVTCPPLDPPENGVLITDSVNARPLHVMLCKEGYDIPRVVTEAFQGRLTCQDSGKWYPLSSFPDCIVQVIPVMKLPAELIYTGDCNNETTQEIIKRQVLGYLAGVLEDVDNSICPDQETCKIENLVIVCGTNSRRRRRRETQHGIFKRQDGKIVVTFNIMVDFDARNKTAENAYLDILDFYENVTELIKEYVNEGKFDIQNLTLSVDAFKSDASPEFVCTDSGYKFVSGSLKCKPCPRGTYLNSTTSFCEYCNIGEYMDHEAATTCEVCPYGYSTLYEGSKNITACIKLCSPGFVSSTVMEPCFACPVGTYQPLLGQTKCESCPYGTATKETNSITAKDCDTFDIFIGTLEEQSVIGTFNAEDSATLTLSLWLKPVNLEQFRLSIYITDIFGETINITFSDYVYVVLGSSSNNASDGTLTKDQWTHIACSFNTISGSMQLYVGGKLIMSETAAVRDSLGTISKGTIEMENISKGIYISGFTLYNRHLDQAGVTSLLQYCAVTAADGLFSMTDMLPHLVQGSSIILPTTCDPVNECETGPCGIHTCINKVDGFECICQNGMTGDLCDIPPDYCLYNDCVNGECVSGNETYRCTCNDGYTGVFCNKPPVNGGWSEWQEWSSCSVTCGGGTRYRSRKCNNPVPGFMGFDCEGNTTDTVACNDHTCPLCPKLEREYGTIVTCRDDLSEDILECNMTCVRGKFLANGQRPYEKYKCGPTTGYIWEPTDKMPACVDVTVPDILGTQVSVTYTDTVSDSDVDDVNLSLEQKFNDFKCETCQLKSTVVSNNVSKNLSKRSTSSTLTLQFSKHLTGNGDIALVDYLTNGTETPAMTELLDTVRSIVAFTEFIQTNSTSIFDVNVGGVEYTTDNNSVSFAGTVTCADGYAGADGLCAQCAAGTRLNFLDCVNCEIGTYQPLQGQSECLPCPNGYTTPTYGAANISECSVIAQTYSSTYSSTISTVTSKGDEKGKHKNDETVIAQTYSSTYSSTISTVTSKGDEKGKHKNDETAVLVVVIVVCVVAISIIVIIALVMWKKHARRPFETNETTPSNFTNLNSEEVSGRKRVIRQN
ncbi:sushi, von Willebrand factor type A, EGF and pentraxin domain-containing protein 1-like isoform X3 [Mercenaria mercenaria]|uniref:sushi, von Willebrand factor type A, EGF and pentraxin domain-containing protein 1-like isoform X3 n=1 Tax=Mercenaria mercenaria TaxID=6596 RepID=UPI00234F7CB2|nr:sushi, von Willebrand factor type A, EGF and pentraxin domain-containing protein 1-like isoform X3 [Mercenaria mercenaria]